jgi:myo-inositol-1(or 4)-monophosphatase
MEIMDIVEILKDACKQVYDQTKDLVGTQEGNEGNARGAGGDISRKIDIVAESAVINFVQEHEFRPTIISEECGRIEGRDEGILVLDAIDGTNNTVREIPFYCCSIAYARNSKLASTIHATVMDLSNGDLYHASDKQGAFLNNKKIHVVRSPDFVGDHELRDMLVGLNISGMPQNLIMSLVNVISEVNHIRQFGANALELCYLARGFLDAYIDIRGKIRATDVAAAYLILREAGGKLYDGDGHELDCELDSSTRLSFVAATNDSIYYRIAGLLKPP